MNLRTKLAAAIFLLSTAAMAAVAGVGLWALAEQKEEAEKILLAYERQMASPEGGKEISGTKSMQERHARLQEDLRLRQEAVLSALALGALVAVAAAKEITRRTTWPLAELIEGVRSIIQGSAQFRFRHYDEKEFDALSTYLNKMAEAQERLGFESLRTQVEGHYDPLTGLLNRRGLEARLPAFLHRQMKEAIPVAILVLDLDHFKRINDTYGHEAGDAVLAAVGATIKHLFRETDLCVRWGGEEFLVLLRGASLREASQVAERFLLALRQLRVPPVEWPITASIGVAGGMILSDAHDLDVWRKQADERAYAAKSGGRNQVVPKAEIAVE